MDEENTLPTQMKSIMISTGKSVGFEEVEAKLAALHEVHGVVELAKLLTEEEEK